MARLIGYVRVSRVAGREGESFISPSVQRERIEAAAAAGGHTLVDVLEDLDQPGSRYGRPAFQEALERVESGEAEGIVVYALDRFARSVPDAAVALRRLDQAGGTLVSVRDALDTSTAVGRFARTMMLALAELELERIRDNWGIARERAITRGVHISRVPPVGYQRRADGRLERDPVAAPVVREMFLRRAAGASWLELCEFLDERLPREHAWTRSTVHDLISRRTYLGEARAGEFSNLAAHEPLVSKAEFDAAQGESRPRGRNGEGALLAGLVCCGSCGEHMTREGSGTRGVWSNYACRGRSVSGVCPSPVKISTARADAYVEGAFLTWLTEQRISLEGLAQSRDQEEAERALEAAMAELATYRDASPISIIGRDAYLDGLRHRQEAIEGARAWAAERRRAGSLTSLLQVDLVAEWPSLSVAERRELLAAAIDSVTVRRASRPGKGSPAAERLLIAWHDAETPEALRVASA